MNGFMVRSAAWADRSSIREVLLTSQIFGPSDAECVDEMFAETWMRPRPDGYNWLVATAPSGQIGGFACFGLESLTKNTWDLFWICLRPEMRGKGAGRLLINEAVRCATDVGGRIMVIYTSSNPAYAPARRLYESAGFVTSAQVPDYYIDGDNLLIYWRRLCPKPV
ncbi:MAG: GNAT family N-acetyltransferase [Chloroflexi bacterium]|nr:GNAT family N-acetyltransferase [Chloroflexota bacterium]